MDPYPVPQQSSTISPPSINNGGVHLLLSYSLEDLIAPPVNRDLIITASSHPCSHLTVPDLCAPITTVTLTSIVPGNTCHV